MNLRAACLVLALTLPGVAGPALAHDARPLSIAIVEQTAGVYRAVVRTPPTVEQQNTPLIVWPDSCDIADTESAAILSVNTFLVSCPGGLELQTVGIDYPFYNPSITTLIRLQAAEGETITAVLPPDELEWVVPPAPTFRTVARDYLVLGFRHIWEGTDHLLFVAGLMVLARRPRKIFWAVTGFTLSHSITLSLAALGLVRLPVTPVEAMIALSIVFLAAEIARNDDTSFSHRYPIALAFVFGLLHGFGFASALGEIGLPASEIAAGLAFFNIGVELGQLAFIAAAAALILVALRLTKTFRPAQHRLWLTAPRASLVSAYCLGIPAAFWFVERAVDSFVS